MPYWAFDVPVALAAGNATLATALASSAAKASLALAVSVDPASELCKRLGVTRRDASPRLDPWAIQSFPGKRPDAAPAVRDTLAHKAPAPETPGTAQLLARCVPVARVAAASGRAVCILSGPCPKTATGSSCTYFVLQAGLAFHRVSAVYRRTSCPTATGQSQGVNCALHNSEMSKIYYEIHTLYSRYIILLKQIV